MVPTYPRHPLALAQQAATAQAFCGGRLTLGVGVSHRPVIEGLHGLPYAAPAAHMREYLSVLGPLLRGEEVHFAASTTGSTAVSRCPARRRCRCWSARCHRAWCGWPGSSPTG